MISILAKRSSKLNVVLALVAATFLCFTNRPLVATISRQMQAMPEADLSLYEKWVEDIAAKMEDSSTKDVYYSMSNFKYSGRFEELLSHSLSCFPKAVLAIVALDTETFDWFTARDVPTLLMLDGTIKERVMSGKFKGSLALLKKDWTVYFSEMDIYWRSTPALNSTLDFIVSEHKYTPNGEINIGFFVARPTSEIIALFSRLSQWVDLPFTLPFANNSTCHAFDQKVMDLAVRGKVQSNTFISGTDPNCILPKDAIDQLLPPSPLNWDYLSAKVLEHWDITHLDSDELAGVHIWGGMGAAPKQIAWAMANFVGTGKGALSVPTNEEGTGIVSQTTA